MSVSNEDKAKAVGHIPSGLFIVCSQKDGKIDGYLASWVQQVSFEPLMVSLAIKPGRPAYDLINSGTNFTINVVGEHEKNYLKHFWKGYDPETNVFAEVPHTITESGAVVLEGAKSTIECVKISGTKPGDHEVFFAEVVNSYVNNEEAKPAVHVRKSGLDY